MKRKNLFAVSLTLLAAFCLNANAIDRNSLAKYAQSLKGLKKAELKSALTKLMNNKDVLGYGSGRGKTWSGFYKTDRNPKTNECYNRYSSKKFYFADGNTNTAISGMNIEHSFPKSWWGGTRNDAYKDLYNLYPSDSKANSSKSNFPMDVVTSATTSEPGYDKVGSGEHTSKAWEPGDRFKGEFARSYMYMGVTYANLTFVKTGLQTMDNTAYPGMQKWATDLYRSWSKSDMVDSLEIARNNAVAAIQNNRNLFIDYPYLAEYVWGDSVDVAFDPYTSITTASDDDRYITITPDNPDDPDTPSDIEYYYVKADKIIDGEQYLIVSEYNNQLLAMAPLAKRYGYPTAIVVNIANDTITTTDNNNAYTFNTSGSGYTIKDYEGRYLYNESKYKTITVSTSGDSEGVWTATFNADGTVKLDFNGKYLQYSTRYNSFGCYTDDQGVMPSLYKKVEKAATAIDAVSVEQTKTPTAVYTIHGQYVGKTLNGLPRGLYIIGGKKVVVR